MSERKVYITKALQYLRDYYKDFAHISRDLSHDLSYVLVNPKFNELFSSFGGVSSKFCKVYFHLPLTLTVQTRFCIKYLQD